MKVKVSESLHVEAVAGKPELRVVREGAGLVTVDLSEVGPLVRALTEAARKQAVALAGEDWQDNVF